MHPSVPNVLTTHRHGRKDRDNYGGKDFLYKVNLIMVQVLQGRALQ